MTDQQDDATTAPLRDALGVPEGAAMFQWPWDIAKKGGQYFSQHSGVAQSLGSAGAAIVGSSAGPSIVAAVSQNPTNAQDTGQVLNNGMFAPALNSLKADQLLRTVFIGWASGAQVGPVGGGGGSGVAYDILNTSDMAAVTYGVFKLGIGVQLATGLLVGAMSSEPSQLNDSTCVFGFGATLGVGTFISVIMTGGNLDLIGFTLTVGAGAGFSTSTGYGKISAT